MLFLSGVIPQLCMNADVLTFWRALHRWHVWEEELALRRQGDAEKATVATLRRGRYLRHIYPEAVSGADLVPTGLINTTGGAGGFQNVSDACISHLVSFFIQQLLFFFQQLQLFL